MLPIWKCCQSQCCQLSIGPRQARPLPWQLAGRSPSRGNGRGATALPSDCVLLPVNLPLQVADSLQYLGERRTRTEDHVLHVTVIRLQRRPRVFGRHERDLRRRRQFVMRPATMLFMSNLPYMRNCLANPVRHAKRLLLNLLPRLRVKTFGEPLQRLARQVFAPESS